VQALELWRSSTILRRKDDNRCLHLSLGIVSNSSQTQFVQSQQVLCRKMVTCNQTIYGTISLPEENLECQISWLLAPAMLGGGH